MKSVWYFLKWHWSKWSVSQRFWLLGTFFFGAGVSDWVQTGQPGLAIQISWGIWAVVFFKWFFWDTTISSWKTFKKEQRDLLETIKKGER